ncbi:MAG: hypothetical protein AABZ47_14130 [Planctomycetota bacterium]
MAHILYWNASALEANRRDFSNVPGTNKQSPEQGGPTLSSRAMAMVHLAMYDAHAGVTGSASLPPYLPGLPAPPPGSTAPAAVAGAAHKVLSTLFPRQKPFFDADLKGAGLSGPGMEPGLSFGRKVADAILEDRKLDPNAGAASYVPSPLPGRHRSDPVNSEQGFHAPVYGAASKGFAIKNRWELDPPPAKGTAEYMRALRDVRGMGIAPELAGTLPIPNVPPIPPNSIKRRTVDETIIGLFWAYDGPRNIGTPPRLYNQIVREVAMAKNTGPNMSNDNARLFALVNAAMGDAGILAWDQKYIHDLWRPVVGIREHDPSMGPAGPTPIGNINDHCDPEWRPLGAPASNSYDGEKGLGERDFTPPFPAYPSGHATFGAACLHMVRLFYGILPGNHSADAIYKGPFVSDELNGLTTDSRGVVRPKHARMFNDGLWQMIVENGLSRVYLGVHWFFDAFALTPGDKPDLNQNIGGVPLGIKIAEDIYAFGNKLAPKKSTVGRRA